MAAGAEDVIEAVNTFFVAVVLVIAGTYILFESVSIAVLKLLKGNKQYYYKTEHFISVSGMMYRMKRNAVGLANICVLSTMVLVILSTTVCLYAGVEDSLQNAYPQEISATFYFRNLPDESVRDDLLGQIRGAADGQDRNMTDVSEYVDVVFLTHTVGNVVEYYDNEDGSYDFTEMGMLYVMTRADYEKFAGQTIDAIAQGEVMVAPAGGFAGDVISVFGTEYPVAGELALPEEFADEDIQAFMGGSKVMYMVVPDNDALEQICAGRISMERTRRESPVRPRSGRRCLPVSRGLVSRPCSLIPGQNSGRSTWE